jgi:hypothetical protein
MIHHTDPPAPPVRAHIDGSMNDQNCVILADAALGQVD